MNALTPIYLVIGLFLATLAWRVACDHTHPRRGSTAVFWAVLALLFLVGDLLPVGAVGASVLLLALLAGAGGVQRSAPKERDALERAASAQRLGNRLFLPVLLIPLTTVIAVFLVSNWTPAGKPGFTAQQSTLLALSFSCLLGLALAVRITKDTTVQAIVAGNRLLDAIGWAAILPLVLAMLGALFAAAGVGEAVAELVALVVPTQSRLACVLAYCLGMAAFTMIMGNAFAAFPVITGGIGLPLLAGQHGAEPASMAAIGMLSGYCGTLMTPMAANFNIVPAALLQLRDNHAVIKAQIPTALLLLAANVVIMYAVVFPRLD